jgi:hypothetical protein
MALTHFSRCFRPRLHGHDVEDEVVMMNEGNAEAMLRMGLR